MKAPSHRHLLPLGKVWIKTHGGVAAGPCLFYKEKGTASGSQPQGSWMLPAGPGAERQNQAFAWTPGGRRPRPGSSRASDGRELPTAPSPTGSWPGAPGSAVQPRPRGHVPPTGHGQGAWSDGQARVREGTQRSEGRGRQLPGGGCGRLGTRGAAEPGSPSQEPCVWKRFKNRSVKQRDPPKRPPPWKGGTPLQGSQAGGRAGSKQGRTPAPVQCVGREKVAVVPCSAAGALRPLLHPQPLSPRK